MKRTQNKYDLVVVGGGHAGIEAALIAHKRGVKTLLVSMDKKSVGRTSCNPAVGGLAKGQMVKEVDVLGGIMGFFADLSTLQSKTLNKSKGRSVWSPRSQIDKKLYEKIAQKYIKEQGLDVLEGEVVSLNIKKDSICGVFLKDGSEVVCSAAVLTCGTFLNGLIHIGSEQINAGRYGEKRAEGVTENLNSLGLKNGRLKTGTPPRIKRSSVNWKKGEAGYGDEKPSPLSYRTNNFSPKDEPCFSFRTNKNTHKIILDNLSSSAMYSGEKMATGPRYCPSIEDKVYKFNQNPSHVLQLEPEWTMSEQIYVNGFSTSLEEKIQLKSLKTVSGLEDVEFIRPGYAIEYDFFYPSQLKNTLESKAISGLFMAGQINGTSGYEEASSQGIIAGINASCFILDENPLILKRDDAYIGVLIDDLILKDTNEPYRMFTSRAEYRLQLRSSNADQRLLKKTKEYNLLDEKTVEKLSEKIEKTTNLVKYLENNNIYPEKINSRLEELDEKIIKEPTRMSNVLKRPKVSISDMKIANEENKNVLTDHMEEEILFEAETIIKYSGYINRQKDEIDKIKVYEDMIIPEKFDYNNIKSLSNESREKFINIKPQTVGQAQRINGIRPSDISILLVYLKRPFHVKQIK
ncbi:tRNA uridine-5-carboxymethylaminomethyl(34) synthesis enzyme MnmG [Candidatus Marinimicrobia bacterium]|nr:tRNA uridine-5-carboxymethylaminomethyl(34) synthesis enzyme MnmG [Candidatus Neomarinimicrobiota bacterium]